MELGLPEDAVTSLADVLAVVCPRASEKAKAHIRQQATETSPILVMIPTSSMLDRAFAPRVGALLAAPSGFPRMRE